MTMLMDGLGEAFRPTLIDQIESNELPRETNKVA
jgi:hypothetical protein